MPCCMTSLSGFPYPEGSGENVETIGDSVLVSQGSF
jgi:hypothetical protein